MIWISGDPLSQRSRASRAGRRLKRSDLFEKLAPGRVFLSTHEATLALAEAGAERALAPAA